MSHFLHNLVVRSLALLPGFQPRVPSLFEGGSATRTIFTEERVESVVPTRSPAVLVPTPPPLSPLAPIAGAVPRQVAWPSILLREAVPSSSAPVASTLDTTSQARIDLSPPPVPSALPAPRFNEPVRAGPIAPIPVAASLRQNEVSHAIRAAPSPLLPAASSLLVERVVQKEHEVRPETVARESLSPVAPPTPVALPAPVPPPAGLARVASAQAEAGPLHAASAPVPPIVQVSIGRIDIRAVHPPASAPARSANRHRGPLVSLEDYLKQRAAS